MIIILLVISHRSLTDPTLNCTVRPAQFFLLKVWKGKIGLKGQLGPQGWPYICEGNHNINIKKNCGCKGSSRCVPYLYIIIVNTLLIISLERVRTANKCSLSHLPIRTDNPLPNKYRHGLSVILLSKRPIINDQLYCAILYCTVFFITNDSMFLCNTSSLKSRFTHESRLIY